MNPRNDHNDDIKARPKDPALSGKVKRNLQIWVTGIIAAISLLIMLFQHFTKEKPRPAPPEDVRNVTPPQLNALKATISAQEELARKQAEEASRKLNQLRDNSLPQPVGLPQLPDAQPRVLQQAEQDALDRQRAKEAAKAEVRASKIIAIENTGGASNADQAPRTDKLNGAAQISPLLTGAHADAKAAPEKPRDGQAAQAQDKEKWYQQSQQISHPGPLTAEAPLSPYTIFQGTVIPAVLVTQINSTIPGMVTAQTISDIYDSINGNTLLIPKGSKLVGEYNNDVAYGDERIAVAFQRLIYPSGASVWLAGAPAADGLGQAGMEDGSTGHFLKLYGSALILGYINYALDKHMQNQSGGNTFISYGNTLGTGTLQPGVSPGSEILYETSKKIIDRMATQAQTITIRQGYRFNLMVNRDMILPPPDTAKRF